MQRAIAKTVATVLVFNAIIPSLSHAADEIFNEKPCLIESKKMGIKAEGVCGTKEVDGKKVEYRIYINPSNGLLTEQYRNKSGQIQTQTRVLQDSEILNTNVCAVKVQSTGAEVTATCGIKKDLDGVLRIYRTFKDPQKNMIVEQFRGLNNQVLTVDRRISPGQQREATAAIRELQISKDVKKEDKAMSTTMKTLIIGGAVVGMAGTLIVGRAIYKGAKSKKVVEAEQARVREAFKNRPAELLDMPTMVTLDRDVPGKKAGKQVAVRGALPTASVGAAVQRYRTSEGQDYILQRNSSTGYLEAFIIYELLLRPHYFNSYGTNYSPFHVTDSAPASLNTTSIVDTAIAAETTPTKSNFSLSNSTDSSPIASARYESMESSGYSHVSRSDDSSSSSSISSSSSDGGGWSSSSSDSSYSSSDSSSSYSSSDSGSSSSSWD